MRWTWGTFYLRVYSKGPQLWDHRPIPVHGLLGTGPHSSRWIVGKWAKLHLYLQLLPITHVTAWALPPVRSVVALDSHRSTNPSVNPACEGSRLCTPYENHSQTIHLSNSLWKNCLPWNWSPGAKKVGGSLLSSPNSSAFEWRCQKELEVRKWRV